jgi:hypothetical protein
LLQVLISFIVCAVMLTGLTLARPLSEPVRLPIREEIAVHTDKKVYIAGSLVIAAVIVFIAIFW